MAEYRRRISGLNSEQVMHAMGIDDAYRVERVLARSSNGVTELVTIEGAGPFIRKKMPTSEASRSVWAALAGNTCARLPQVAATYEMPDWFVSVYDYVPGETLEDVVGRAESLDEPVAVQIVQDVCKALSALHACGVVHLDVSPKNVIIAADGAHLIDFGNARCLAASSGDKKRGRPKGTWGFAAPEQFFCMADERSDVFAAGRLLGYMLTGVYPDEEGTDAFEKALEDEGTVPKRLRSVIEKATSFEPSARQHDVSCLSLELTRALNGEEDPGVGETRSENLSVTGMLDVPAARSEAMHDGHDGQGADGSRSESREQGGAAHVRGGRQRWSAGKIAMVMLAAASVCMALAVAYIAMTAQEPKLQDRDSKPITDEPLTQNDGLHDEPGDGDLFFGEEMTEGAEPSASDLQRAHESLEIVESGWGVSKNGYVGYALTLANTSDDLIVEFPEVLITGRDEDGSVLFSDTQVLQVVFPGAQVTYACQAGNGTAPATVEFSVSQPKDYQVSVGKGKPTEFKIAGLTERSGGYGTTRFTGEVTTVSTGDELLARNGVWLSIIMRDAEGKIVYGANGHVTQPPVGESTTFEVEPYDCPEYASAEAVAMAW